MRGARDAARPAIPLQPINDDAFDGRYQLLSDGTTFSVARWDGERFVYSNKAEIEFTPTHFHVTGARA